MTTASYRNFTSTLAANYQRFFVPAVAAPASVGLMRAAELQPGERVLDVACGTGLVARLAAEQVGPAGSVTGVDIASDMIEVAKAVPAAAGPPVEWLVGDATALDLADGAFDVVLCQLGLMFMADRPVALGEMRRVLVDGGRLVVTTAGRIQGPFSAMEQALVDHIGPELGGFVSSVFSMHDPAAVAALLGQAGFDAVSATETVTPLRLPPPAELLWEYLDVTPIAPMVAAASGDARAALERQVVEGCQPFVVDGATLVDQPLVVASGVRRDG